MKIDVGCGTKKKYGFTGVDIAQLPGVDVVADFDKDGLPFAENSIEEIFCSHVLEHMTDLTSIMKEFYRVLKPGGSVTIRVPHCFSPSAFGDSTHKLFFTFDTFSQFDQKHPRSYYYDFHFVFVRSRMQIIDKWYKPNPFGRFLEWLVNRNKRKGERMLKVIFYKDWEVETLLAKPSEQVVQEQPTIC